MFTSPHLSQCEKLYKQHNGSPRGQPVPSTHQDVPAERTWGRSSVFPAGRPWIFQKIKKHPGLQFTRAFFFSFLFGTQVSSGLWQKNLYELIYFRPFVHLKKLSLTSHSEINISFFLIIYTKLLKLLSHILIRSRRVLETFHFDGKP